MEENGTTPYHYCEFEYTIGMCGEIALHKVKTEDGKYEWLCYTHFEQLRMEELGWDRFWEEKKKKRRKGDK